MPRPKLRLVFLALLAVALLPAAAPAALIIDTGIPTGPNNWVLASDQYLAGKFYLDKSYVITDAQGYMERGGFDPHNHLAGKFYAPDADTGLPGTELSEFLIIIPERNTAGWYGSDGPLGLTLGPGWYWLSFESPPYFSGVMRDVSPAPLAAYAFWDGEAETWYSKSESVGIRVYGEALPVPLPGALGLLALGLAGLGLRRRRG